MWGEAHLAILRDSYWLCAQELLLAVHGIPYGMTGIEVFICKCSPCSTINLTLLVEIF